MFAVEFFLNGASIGKALAQLSAPVHFLAGCDKHGKVHLADWAEMSSTAVAALDSCAVTQLNSATLVNLLHRLCFGTASATVAASNWLAMPVRNAPLMSLHILAAACFPDKISSIRSHQGFCGGRIAARFTYQRKELLTTSMSIKANSLLS